MSKVVNVVLGLASGGVIEDSSGKHEGRRDNRDLAIEISGEETFFRFTL